MNNDKAPAKRSRASAGRSHRNDVAVQHLALDTAAIVAVTDVKGTITDVNDKFCSISGYSRRELLGQNHRILKSGCHAPEVFRQMYRTIARGGVWRGELCNRAKNGALYWVDTIVVPRLDGNGKPEAYVSIRFDITDRKAAETSLASHRRLIETLVDRADARICMLNPAGGAAFYRERVGRKYKLSARRVRMPRTIHAALEKASGSCTAALHLIGIDHFKAVNESYGHAFGDTVLRAFERRLKAAAGGAGDVIPISGDEFAVVQLEAGSEDQALAFADRLLATVNRRELVLDGIGVAVSASAGICLTASGRAPGRLLQQARSALSSAKRAGRGRSVVFRADLDLRVQARQSLERDMREALKDRQFCVRYQPILSATSGEIVSAECLVRWQHPLRGLVAAGDFVPVAEETGLICEIGDAVLKQACRDAMAWPSHVCLAVNISAVQFRRGRVLDAVELALQASGLSPARLELEITETALLEASYQNLETLHRLRALGIRISLDDFGTGFSSLSYLQVFPFDKIKIDRSFVSDLGNRAGRAGAIVKAVSGLANMLGMTVVAEGVECSEQHAEVVSLGCNEVQGYLYGKPQSQAELLAALAGTRAVCAVA